MSSTEIQEIMPLAGLEDDGEPPFQEVSPAADWDEDAARRALDELFRVAGEYKSTKAYREVLDFVGRFRFYSPYNAMLVYIQMPGALYVAPAHRWLGQYRRRIRPGAHPLIILQPMGPVMFVFDVTDTVPENDAPPLPPAIDRPFEVRSGHVGNELSVIIESAKRDGVRITRRDAGSQNAGQIRNAEGENYVEMLIKQKPAPEYARFRVRYELLLNSRHSNESMYATLVHELGHLYCGHLGTPNPKWWPDRQGLSESLREFEAESICYLLCSRLGIDNPSAEYLSGYMNGHQRTPDISIECIMKSAGLIEQMGHGLLKPRKN
jgi:hypothetical protein